MSTTIAASQQAPAGLHGHRIRPGNMLRAGVAEAIGTFFLIYTGTATAGADALGKSTAGSPPESLAVALAFGLVLAALVGGLGQVSGAHLNGAVTLGLAVTGKFPWRYVPAYLDFQLLGAITGAGATWATFGSVVRSKAHLGATVPAPGVGDLRALVVEALITFLLVFVIMAVATDPRVPAALAAPSIGFALVGAVLIGGGISSGAVNPNRALGPAIMSGTFTSLWIYVLADILGGVVAALLYTHVVIKATPRPWRTATPGLTVPPATAAWPPVTTPLLSRPVNEQPPPVAAQHTGSWRRQPERSRTTRHRHRAGTRRALCRWQLPHRSRHPPAVLRRRDEAASNPRPAQHAAARMTHGFTRSGRATRHHHQQPPGSH